MFLSRGHRDLGVAFQTHLVSQALSRGEAKDSILLSRRDADAWQDEALARDGVSREVPCSALKGETVPDSLPAHDEDLREPLVRRQGSQVSMRVARGSASWLSSHGRGLGPRAALKKDSRGLYRGAAGNPRVLRLLPGTLGNFPGCL